MEYTRAHILYVYTILERQQHVCSHIRWRTRQVFSFRQRQQGCTPYTTGLNSSATRVYGYSQLKIRPRFFYQRLHATTCRYCELHYFLSVQICRTGIVSFVRANRVKTEFLFRLEAQERQKHRKRILFQGQLNRITLPRKTKQRLKKY